MKTTEDVFCESFYRWWRDQTAPQKMTWETAKKIIEDCRTLLKTKLIPHQMTQDNFDEYLGTAQKVVIFGVSWDEAKVTRLDDLQKERNIPKN